jgi:hypothetical protein
VSPAEARLAGCERRLELARHEIELLRAAVRALEQHLAELRANAG